MNTKNGRKIGRQHRCDTTQNRATYAEDEQDYLAGSGPDPYNDGAPLEYDRRDDPNNPFAAARAARGIDPNYEAAGDEDGTPFEKS